MPSCDRAGARTRARRRSRVQPDDVVLVRDAAHRRIAGVRWHRDIELHVSDVWLIASGPSDPRCSSSYVSDSRSSASSSSSRAVGTHVDAQHLRRRHRVDSECRPADRRADASRRAARRATRRTSRRMRVAIDRQIDLLAERRQALITAAVTGQLDIPEARVSRSARALEDAITGSPRRARRLPGLQVGHRAGVGRRLRPEARASTRSSCSPSSSETQADELGAPRRGPRRRRGASLAAGSASGSPSSSTSGARSMSCATASATTGRDPARVSSSPPTA